MSEIKGNLKRDVKDLLGESANLFTQFIRNGLCSVRAAADKWKSFAKNISGAVGTLFQPPFDKEGPEAPLPTLDARAEPIVTIVEGCLGAYQPGQQMSLSNANRLIRREGIKQRGTTEAPLAVKIKIDYVKDGQTDRYWLPIDLSQGGSLLEQMQRHIENYRTHSEQVAVLFKNIPAEHRQRFQEELKPFINEHINGLSQSVLQFFQRHCDIAALEQQFQAQAVVLPEKEQKSFLQAAEKTIASLRASANASPLQEHDQKNPIKMNLSNYQDQQAGGEKPRVSITVRLRSVQEKNSKHPTAKKAHTTPQR